jgi:hypothetical protein
MAYTTINKSSDYFNTKLYTGNGATSSAGTLARTITGVGFQPDFTWVKERTSVSGGYTSHSLHDAVRTAPMTVESNSTSAEQNVTTQYGNGGIGSFTSDGFGIYSGTGGNSNNFNVNSGNYVTWNWLANGQGSSNTDGSINTTYTSVNTTAGFSISKFTGTGANATVGHGLGAVPKMIIIKNLVDTEPWIVYHAGIDATAPQDYHLRLNTTDARINEAAIWNDTAPTSSVFSLGSSGAPNGSGDATIAYCFAEKTGYSKFGSYVGNGNADGTFIYTGFKPAFVMLKRSSNTSDWYMFDNKREGYNVDNDEIYANLSNAEDTADRLDILSNGFKMRTTGGNLNASGETFIYMAFAEAPLVGSNNIPANAR